MRKYIKILILICVGILSVCLPNSLFKKILHLIGNKKPYFLDDFYKKVDYLKAEKLYVPFIGVFNLMSDRCELKYKEHVLDPENYEFMPLQQVYGLSKGGTISLFKKEISLFRFDNAIFHPLPDVIRVGDFAYWDKLSRPQLVKMIVADLDVIKCSPENGKIMLKNYPIGSEFDVGFSLCGVHATSWGHFIINFLPKIVAIESICTEHDLKIIVPKGVDSHIKEFISRSIDSIGNFEIVFVDDDELVRCHRLYYCNATSFLSDHGNYLTTHDIQITKFSLDAINRFSKITQTAPSGDQAKLYIGRRGGRNLGNFAEIEDYFISQGFQIVFPHLMTFEEKVKLFNIATHICGPYSSGFLNVIFCKPGTKALAFSNYARTQDSALGAIGASDFNCEVHILTGSEIPSADPHNAYSIPLQRIKKCVEDIKFLV